MSSRCTHLNWMDHTHVARAEGKSICVSREGTGAAARFTDRKKTRLQKLGITSVGPKSKQDINKSHKLT